MCLFIIFLVSFVTSTSHTKNSERVCLYDNKLAVETCRHILNAGVPVCDAETLHLVDTGDLWCCEINHGHQSFICNRYTYTGVMNSSIHRCQAYYIPPCYNHQLRILYLDNIQWPHLMLISIMSCIAGGFLGSLGQAPPIHLGLIVPGAPGRT